MTPRELVAKWRAEVLSVGFILEGPSVNLNGFDMELLRGGANAKEACADELEAAIAAQEAK